MHSFLKHLPEIVDVYQESVKIHKPFDKIAQFFADDKGSVLLFSGSDNKCSRYHILAIKPWLEILSFKGITTLKCSLFQKDNQKHSSFSKKKPFLIINTLIKKIKNKSFDFPVNAGLFGYFAYDLKKQIEKLPITCMDTGLPDLCLYAPCIIFIHDKKTGKSRLCIPIFNNEKLKISAKDYIKRTKDYFFNKLKKENSTKGFAIDDNGFRSSVSKLEYKTCVNKILDYLKAGDIYQANFAQRFEIGFSGSAYSLFLNLLKKNPASFFSFINAGDHKIVSTSPERFVKQEGRFIETKPIKGTIRRGENKKKDKRNKLSLLNSAKDSAELAMIVDLMRNDLSKVSTKVVVKEHKALEAYENVFHLVSTVQGKLRKNKTSIDLLKAVFPGGSITGCPKIRAMEVIDELEPVKRHVYTGAIGYISFHNTMDLSIAIRTAIVVQNKIFFSAGGGIVADSKPKKEYLETIYKVKTFMETLSLAAKKKTKKIKAWVNGKIIDQDKAKISALSSGFQYGTSVFETIKAEKSTIFRLKYHVKRLEKSWKNLFGDEFLNITWKDVIKLLIKENDFCDKSISIKIIVAYNNFDSENKVFAAIFVKEYEHRLQKIKKQGFDLVAYPYTRSSFLADHKTTNYLFYDQARKFALKNNSDEAIILNSDLTISETNTCNIFAIKGGEIILPYSKHVLPGISLRSILKILKHRGYKIIKKKIGKKEFCLYPNIIVSNSLIGAVKVLSIDKQKIKHDVDFCSMINKHLFKIQ